MLMNTANETMWDLIRIDAILWDRDIGESTMPEVTIFQFYSDTNQNNAFDELSGMALDGMTKQGTTIEISLPDMSAMGDSIVAIVQANGGEAV